MVIETENGSKAGLVVDELIGQQQVVVKSLLENFDAVHGISGATILGDGRVALILDLDGLCKLPEHWRAEEEAACEALPETEAPAQTKTQARSMPMSVPKQRRAPAPPEIHASA